ncbi:pentapeptide repeat-containing protein [Lachnospiraceae bacterium 45-W7]
MEMDNKIKYEINVNNGQAIFAGNSATIYATQNNGNEDINKKIEEFKNNKKQAYINNWNRRLFLHLDNDENPITLADAFIIPDYKMHESIKRIRFSADDTLEQIIDKFIKYNKSSTMLITGVPGIGKSSITSWLAHRYKEDDNVIILRFRDWEAEELENGLLKAICNTLECKKKDLENKILIIDGFDEMKLLNQRDDILAAFINSLKDFEKYKCIITSRPVYIDSKYFDNVFELKEFNLEKIEFFCRKITKKGFNQKEKIKSNLQVLGIPVILYMAIMSNVDISKNPTKPELYNRIFAEKGGIFDRFYLDGIGYDNGSQLLRSNKNVKEYLEFLHKVSFEMFESNCMVLEKKDCKIPDLEFCGSYISVLEFPIKYFFEHTETNIEFIHKSIYEYFISEYIFMEICKGTQLSKDKFAGILGDLLKKNYLSMEILVFLRFKIRNSELSGKFDIVNAAFNIMLENGMTYYTGRSYKNVIDCELYIFVNMLELLHLWEDSSLVFEQTIFNYMKYNKKLKLNLKGVNLMGLKLEALDFKRANLRGANLAHANLIHANLVGVDLVKANLEEANLFGADLRDAKLNEANLSKVNFFEAKLNNVKLRGANLTDARLYRTDLRGADLTEVKLDNANLSEADLEASIWTEDEINKFHLQLVDAKFTYIIEVQEKKKIYREDLFAQLISG